MVENGMEYNLIYWQGGIQYSTVRMRNYNKLFKQMKMETDWDRLSLSKLRYIYNIQTAAGGRIQPVGAGR